MAAPERFHPAPTPLNKLHGSPRVVGAGRQEAAWVKVPPFPVPPAHQLCRRIRRSGRTWLHPDDTQELKGPSSLLLSLCTSFPSNPGQASL